MVLGCLRRGGTLDIPSRLVQAATIITILDFIRMQIYRYVCVYIYIFMLPPPLRPAELI